MRCPCSRRRCARPGVAKGDRVAGYLPNMPEAVIAMLATTSIGALWSSASPDFGVRGVVDRFGQIAPKVLFSADGYFYGGKRHDSIGRLASIAAQIPSIERIVVVPYTAATPDVGTVEKAVTLDEFVAGRTPADIVFERLSFDHPLYIMYSSGTTGAPKCIVHGAGGTLLQHIKELALHSDVKRGERILYFTTCGWMMWNWQVSALACGATLALYDGSPFHPDGNALFDFVAEEGIEIFGASAKFIDAVKKAGLAPAKTHDLSKLKAILSTGSPLVPESFDFVYESIKRDLCLSSISGGTDIISCFVVGNPAAPVYRGEIQCLGLGLDVRAFDDEGLSVTGEKGELVCTRAFPSMPVGFWNDPGGRKYHDAYFARFDNIWRHGGLRGDHRARRGDHLRPLRRGAQPRRGAHWHRRDLPPGRAARRSGGSPGHRPAVGRRCSNRGSSWSCAVASISTRRWNRKSDLGSAPTRRRVTCPRGSCG